jgi:hypothetical protein
MLQRGRAVGRGGTPFQLVEERRNLGPVAQISVLRDERTRPMRGQFSEWQQVHARRIRNFFRGEKPISLLYDFLLSTMPTKRHLS